MITLLIVVLAAIVCGTPLCRVFLPHLCREASSDTNLILSFLCVISDIHILLWFLRGRK